MHNITQNKQKQNLKSRGIIHCNFTMKYSKCILYKTSPKNQETSIISHIYIIKKND